MRNIISFMHLSLDGFVAGPNGEMNWIKVDQELFDRVGQRIGETNAALYGRKTFEMMEHYWPTAADKPDASKHDIEHAAWYKTARKIVLSTTLKEADFSNTTVVGDRLPERIREIKQEAGPEILLFGSPTATHLLQQLNLIDGYWLFINPVILGKGIPLFTDMPARIDLKLLGTRSFSNGVTELNYCLAEK